MNVDPRLRSVIDELEATGGAVELLDPEWTLIWVSSELAALLGTDDRDALGYGRHILECYQRPPWRTLINDESAALAFARNVPYIAHGTPGGIKCLRELADAGELAAALEDVEPLPPPPVWAFPMTLVERGASAGRVWCYTVRLHDSDGGCIGIVRLYSVGLPARLLALAARGDEELFARMAEVADAGPRASAVLFADLDSSGLLSRRLAGAAYFQLISAIGAGVDAAVIDRHGIVGKHAGDGATAFFLVEQLGSQSAAARAAIETAYRLPDVVAAAANELAEAGVPVDAVACRMNVGVHWGASLFIGRLATRGRLEVTALGDEVNECARIEQSARDGQLLASKTLLERLSADDARALGIEVETQVYRPLAELPGAARKATRDAGAVAVTELNPASRPNRRLQGEVAEGVFMLGTRWVNFYLVVDGDDCTLVDGGYSGYQRQLAGLLGRIGLRPEAIAGVIVTHHHVDHVGVAERLRGSNGASVFAHEDDAPIVTGERRSHVPPGFYRHAWRPSMARYLAHTVRAGGARYHPVSEVVRVGGEQTLDLPGRPRVIPTPGHTAGHCSVVLADRGVLFTGDAMVNFDYATGRNGLRQHRFNEDRGAALRSLDRLDGIDAETVLFGHGDPYTDGSQRALAAVRERAG